MFVPDDRFSQIADMRADQIVPVASRGNQAFGLKIFPRFEKRGKKSEKKIRESA
jgi:hypothetical protein